MNYVVLKMMAHNICDRAVYAEENIAFNIFAYTPGCRQIGVISDDDEIPLLEADGNSISIIKLDGKSVEELVQLHEIREQWLYTWTHVFKKKCEDEMKAVFEQASSPTSRRQHPVNFKKEILKRMEKCNRLFINRKMEGYDFREIPLGGAVFINCSLAGANMSNVDLTDSVFVNCNLTDILLYNAVVNNSFIYSDCKVTELKDLKKGAVYNVRN